jgi:HlyD family secretion protein
MMTRLPLLDIGRRALDAIEDRCRPLLDRLVPPSPADEDLDIAGSGMDRTLTRRRNPRRILMAVLGGALLAVPAIWLMVGFGGSVYRVPSDRLTIGTVTQGPFEDYAAVRGTVAPSVTIYLTTDQGGAVKQVLVEDGARVKAGQPIMALSNPTLQMQFASRQVDTARQIGDVHNTELQIEQTRFTNRKELLNIEYELQTLKSDLDRDQRLYAAKAISLATYEKDRDRYAYEQKLREVSTASFRTAKRIQDMQLKQLRETLAQLNDNLAAARANLDALVIRAPMDGQLTALDAEVGQSKAAGAVLGQVDSADRFKLTAQVDEFYLGRVLLGQDALLTIDGRDFRARVSKLYPQVSNGTFKTDLKFDGPAPEGVHAGQAVDLKLELGGAKTALMLPNGQFYQDTGGAWAFVLSADGRKAVRRAVRLGRKNPGFVEVLDGLKPGERVIVSSYEAFKTVDTVKLESPSNDNP